MSVSLSAVEKAFDILSAIQARGGAAGVSDVSRAVTLPKSTVHRILASLERCGAVRQLGEADAYSLGHSLIGLGLSAMEGWDLLGIVTPRLEELRDRLGDTVTLAVRARQGFSYIALAPSHGEYYFSPRLGGFHLLHWGATGKVILAFTPPAEMDAYLQDVPLTSATRRTITDPAVLREQLAQIRSDGFAVSYGELLEGSGGVAAPICDRDGTAYAAVVLIAPAERMRALDAERIGRALKEVCISIESACRMSGSASSEPFARMSERRKADAIR